MSVGAWLLVIAIAYVALGHFVGSALRSAREQQTTPLPPPVQSAGRDEQLDITSALDRSRT